jgi:[acyl-carrier-protein] S-malonyltransferase
MSTEPSPTPHMALVFPGQGSQFPGMGEDLARAYPAAGDAYEQASRVLGYDLLAACRDEHGELADTTVVQPAVLTHSVATWRALREELPDTAHLTAMAGHSLGEVSALVCAGGLDFERAVALVQRRAELMSQAPPGGMSVVFGLATEAVERVCRQASTPGHLVTLANVNSREQTVISGHREALDAVTAPLEELGGVVRRLKISIAAHSPLMAAATGPFASAVREAAPRDAATPVVSAIDGAVYRTGEESARRLVGQLTDCVSWPSALDGLLGLGVETVIELGPKTVLRDLTRAERPTLTALACGDPESVTAVARFFASHARRAAGATVGREPAERFLLGCLRLAVGTPSPRRHTPETYLTSVRRPYEELRETLDTIREHPEHHHDPGVDTVVGAAQRTLSLLTAKGVEAGTGRELLGATAGAAGVEEEVLACLM